MMAGRERDEKMRTESGSAGRMAASDEGCAL